MTPVVMTFLSLPAQIPTCNNSDIKDTMKIIGLLFNVLHLLHYYFMLSTWVHPLPTHPPTPARAGAAPAGNSAHCKAQQPWLLKPERTFWDSNECFLNAASSVKAIRAIHQLG